MTSLSKSWIETVVGQVDDEVDHHVHESDPENDGLYGLEITGQVRATVLEELNKDYVLGAKARGVRGSVTLWRSVLKSSMLTIITLLALSIGSL